MSPSPSGEHVGQLRGWSVLNRKGGVKAVLCGDLGGTNSRLVLYEVPPLYEGGDAAPEKPMLERRSSRSWYFRSIAGGGGDQAAAAEPAGGGDGGGGGRKLIPLAHRQAQLATVGSQYPIFKPKAYKNELFESFSAVVHEFIRESGCVAPRLFFCSYSSVRNERTNERLPGENAAAPTPPPPAQSTGRATARRVARHTNPLSRREREKNLHSPSPSPPPPPPPPSRPLLLPPSPPFPATGSRSRSSRAASRSRGRSRTTR